jgi:fructose-1-phosphate kinase PfkB-like protein
MAFDQIETPFGKTDKIIGGAGTFIAWCASNFTGVKQISVVGGDFPQAELDALTARGVLLEGVQIKKDEKTFFWSGRYHLDMNTRDTLVTELNVLGDFKPVVPDSYQDCEFLMLGNLAPSVQSSVIDQLKTKMNFWMDIALDDLKHTLSLVNVLMVNDSEARQLSGDYSLVRAAQKIAALGPKYVIIKKGEHGALLFHNNQIFSAPALPLEEVFDPTGAGDTFAGGLIAHLAKTKDISFENMKTAIIVGSAMASFSVEKFGTERLRSLTLEEIHGRIKEFVDLSTFDISLV